MITNFSKVRADLPFITAVKIPNWESMHPRIPFRLCMELSGKNECESGIRTTTSRFGCVFHSKWIAKCDRSTREHSWALESIKAGSLSNETAINVETEHKLGSFSSDTPCRFTIFFSIIFIFLSSIKIKVWRNLKHFYNVRISLRPFQQLNELIIPSPLHQRLSKFHTV